MKVYHHNDLDGRAAGMITHYLKPPRIEDFPDDYFECNYHDKFDKHTTKDDVVIVDLAISEDTYPMLVETCKTAKSVTWIDHHQSSVKVVENHKDELQSLKNLTYFVSKCACGAALAYCYFSIPRDDLQHYRDTTENEYYNIGGVFDEKGIITITLSKSNKNDPSSFDWKSLQFAIPRWLRYVDDFDCWRNLYPDSNSFELGCRSYNCKVITAGKNSNTFNMLFWSKVMATNDHKSMDDPSDFSNVLIDRGDIIGSYRRILMRDQLNNTFEWTYEGTTFICKNGTMKNSFEFSHLYDKYDACILFYYNGSSGTWDYSVYSSNHSKFNCGEFASKFPGGGGHKGAAGFSTKTLIFNDPEFDNNQDKDPIIFLGGVVYYDWREAFISAWKKNLTEKDKDIEIFNPIVDDYTDECVKKEVEIKSKAALNLFVLVNSTEGQQYSIGEAVDSANKGSKTFVALLDTSNNSSSLKTFNRIGEQLIETHKGCKYKVYDFSRGNWYDELVRDVKDVLYSE